MTKVLWLSDAGCTTGFGRVTHSIGERLPTPGDAPLIIVEPVKSALRICASNNVAASLGLQPGTTLADARAMYPSLVVHDADRQADATLLDAVADWCGRYTPLVGIDPPEGLFLEVSGCAHLFSGERALGRDLIARLSRQGLQTRIGLADTPGCAWAVARYGATPLVPTSATRDALLPLPIAALRLDTETIAALARASSPTGHRSCGNGLRRSPT